MDAQDVFYKSNRTMPHIFLEMAQSFPSVFAHI